MKNLFLFVLLIPLVTGCSAILLSADNEGVVVTNVSKATAGDADRIADKECAKYGRQAFRMSLNKADSSATYKCLAL